MHPLGEKRGIITEGVGCGFARIFRPARLDDRVPLCEKFSLFKEIDALDPPARIEQPADFRTQFSRLGEEPGLSALVEPKRGASIKSRRIDPNSRQFEAVPIGAKCEDSGAIAFPLARDRDLAPILELC